MVFSYRSGDIGYYNGTTPDISGFENIFVCTIRCNQGGIDRTTYADQQTGWVSSHLGFSSQYVFNGNVDPYSAGILFGQQGLPGFVPGKSGILVDCEDEGATNTHAWGPVQANAFITGVRSVRPDIPVSAFFIYHNYTVNRRFNWQGCADAGMGLVYARPGGPDDYLYWPANFDRYIKQDGTVNGVDADWHNTAWSQIIGVTPTPQTTEEDVALICAKDQPGTPAFLFAPGYVKHLADPTQLQAASWSTRLGAADQFDNNDFQRSIWNYGLAEFTIDQVIALSHGTNPDGTPNTNGGGMLIASWLKSGAVEPIDYDKLTTALVGKFPTPPTVFQIDSIPGKAVAA